MTLYCVYKHQNKVNNKIYIGLTSNIDNPNLRWHGGNGYKNNLHFYRAIQKYGWENFTHEIIKTNLTLSQANDLEKQLIQQYNSTNPEYGYNIQAGGANAKHSEETKQKIREKALQWSEETKKKMSESARRRVKRDGAPFAGKHHTEESKEKIRKADRSYTQTTEYRQKMSLATSGAKNGQAIKVRAYDKNYTLCHQFGCKKDALIFLGLSRSSGKFLNNAIKQHSLYHNYYWEEDTNGK